MRFQSCNGVYIVRIDLKMIVLVLIIAFRQFPMSVCRYPDMTGILTRLGAGLGLVNGLLVTVRILIRAVSILISKFSISASPPPPPYLFDFGTVMG